MSFGPIAMYAVLLFLHTSPMDIAGGHGENARERHARAAQQGPHIDESDSDTGHKQQKGWREIVLRSQDLTIC